MEFETTFDALYPALFRYCHRLTGDPDVADDIAQEAFVRLYRSEVTGGVEGARAWLFRTATHLVRDRYRVEENRKRLLEANPVRPATPESPEEEVGRSEEIARVRAALAKLSARDREMLMMKQEGFSYRDIAETVDVAPASVGTLLARAKRHFVTVLEQDKEIDVSSR